jgi:hypothetical protein
MPGIFTDRELGLLRREAEEFIGGYTCRVMREPAGSAEDEPTVHYAARACLYLPETTKEEVIRGGGTQVVTTPAQVWFAHGTDVTSADFINLVTDQLGAVVVDEALFITDLAVLDSHIEATLAGTRV